MLCQQVFELMFQEQPEAPTVGVLNKKVFLKISQNSQKNACARVCLLISCRPQACNFIRKETLAQVFSCEFCEICKSIFFTEDLRTTASERLWMVPSDLNYCRAYPKNCVRAIHEHLEKCRGFFFQYAKYLFSL